MFSAKLKGGALYIAIFLSLVIAVLMSMIILMSYYNTLDYDGFLIEDKVQNNARSALNYCIASGEEIKELKTTDLFGNGDDSVALKSRWWGCYKAVAVKAFKKKYSIQYNCFVGCDLPKDTCLICPGKNKPVSVSGKTKFTGLCFLTKQGVKTAYVDGQNFIGDKPVDGRIAEINQLPELDKNFLARTEQLMNGYNANNDSSITMEEFQLRDSIVNSFINKTLFIHSDGVIIISHKYLEGNVIIHSSRKIILEANAQTKEILLIAPKIEIRERFKGSLQAFASDTLKTAKEVNLQYPSSLVVFDTGKGTKEKHQPVLFIDEKNLIKGQVITINNSKAIDKSSYLRVSKESLVTGTVFCDGYLDLQANVNGVVIANSFLLVTPSSVYENHVLNAVVNRKDISDYFMGGMMFSDRRKKSIAKWLN